MDNRVLRIGVIAPPANVALERELPRYLPEGVVTNHNRLSRPEARLTKESLLVMAESASRAAADLAYARPDVVMYGCTSGSFLDGFGNETKVADRIAAQIGVPTFSTSTAVLEALRALSARRLFMLTPYPDEVNEHELGFLAFHGFEVPAWDSFRCALSADIAAITSDQVVERVLANRARIAGCDAVFVSCTNLLVMDRIEALEAAVGVPLVTSNQASLWAALRRLGVATNGIGCGRLFRQAVA